MLQLVSDGYRKKTVQDRINYGLQLRAALEEFTEDFLPHMRQEEEVRLVTIAISLGDVYTDGLVQDC